MKKIIGARRPSGTTFYEIEPDVFLAAVMDASDESINIWHKHLAKTKSLAALDVDHMYGSQILTGSEGEDALYFCVTDGEEIEVAGEMVDPEEALDEYSIEALSDAGFVEGTSQDQVFRLISDSDFRMPDFNREIEEALESWRFTDLADAYEELKEE